jgi:hypothetical protein
MLLEDRVTGGLQPFRIIFFTDMSSILVVKSLPFLLKFSLCWIAAQIIATYLPEFMLVDKAISIYIEQREHQVRGVRRQHRLPQYQHESFELIEGEFAIIVAIGFPQCEADRLVHIYRCSGVDGATKARWRPGGGKEQRADDGVEFLAVQL